MRPRKNSIYLVLTKPAVSSSSISIKPLAVNNDSSIARSKKLDQELKELEHKVMTKEVFLKLKKTLNELIKKHFITKQETLTDTLKELKTVECGLIKHCALVEAYKSMSPAEPKTPVSPYLYHHKSTPKRNTLIENINEELAFIKLLEQYLKDPNQNQGLYPTIFGHFFLAEALTIACNLETLIASLNDGIKLNTSSFLEQQIKAINQLHILWKDHIDDNGQYPFPPALELLNQKVQVANVKMACSLALLNHANLTLQTKFKKSPEELDKLKKDIEESQNEVGKLLAILTLTSEEILPEYEPHFFAGDRHLKATKYYLSLQATIQKKCPTLDLPSHIQTERINHSPTLP